MGGLGSLFPLLLTLVVIVPFLLLMNRKQRKEERARAALKKGDRVTVASGILGELSEIDDRIAKVKIASGVTIQVLATTVSPFPETQKAGDKDPKEAKPASDKK